MLINFFFFWYIPKKITDENILLTQSQKLNTINEQRITTDTTSALVNNLKPEIIYEIKVRAVLPYYGIESNWSDSLFVAPPLNFKNDIDENKQSFFTPAFGIQREMEFCNFESISICDFINDNEATIIWRRKIIKSDKYLGYFF